MGHECTDDGRPAQVMLGSHLMIHKHSAAKSEYRASDSEAASSYTILMVCYAGHVC